MLQYNFKLNTIEKKQDNTTFMIVSDVLVLLFVK